MKLIHGLTAIALTLAAASASAQTILHIEGKATGSPSLGFSLTPSLATGTFVVSGNKGVIDFTTQGSTFHLDNIPVFPSGVYDEFEFNGLIGQPGYGFADTFVSVKGSTRADLPFFVGVQGENPGAPLYGYLNANLKTSSVPEPGSLALLLPGSIPLGLAIRKRKAQSLLR